MEVLNLVWVDQQINSKQNTKYKEIIESMGNYKIKYFLDINEAMVHLKSIKYEETFIIVSGRLYTDLIGNLIKNFSELYIIPKIIIFTSKQNKSNIEEMSKELNNGKYYHFGGIFTSINSIIDFILKYSKKEDITFGKDNIYFEPIDKKEKLILPLLYKILIEIPSNENIKKLTEYLNNEYGQKNKEIEFLFNSIKHIDDIPLELLSKYYSKIFYYNDNLKFEEKTNELTFAKVLYEGIKLKSLPLTFNNVLYMGCFLNKEFIDGVKDSVIKKNRDLPAAILFSEQFLTFSKDKFTANNILNINNTHNLNNVLLILENANSIDFSLSTHFDFENKVIFLPFSSFEIKDIKNIENKYEIKLSYLGKYLDNLRNDEKISKNNIPNSEFKEKINSFGLINSIKNNIKELIEKYDIYKLTFKVNYLNYQKLQKKLNEKYNINNNYIIGELNVDEDGKEIRIINSCNYNDKTNREEIERVKITINGKLLDNFSYFHKFPKKGKYNIKYDFEKNYLKKACYMFSECEALTYLDFSNLNSNSICDMSSMFSGCKFLKTIIFYEFKTENVTDMSYLFSGCKSLENIDLSDFNSDKVTNMSNMFFGCELLRNIDLSNIKNTEKLTDISSMFSGCESLTNINLSKLNTKNVTDMSYMFYGCKSLPNINLSNFDTENVIDMSWMFSGCEALIDINLSNFKSKHINNISSMFSGCKKLMNVDFSNLNTKDDTNMCCIFNGCKGLAKVNLSNFNTIMETNLFSMFHESKPSIECKSIAAKNAMEKEF